MKALNYICTINPACNSSVASIERLIYKGMTVARLNFSHGNHEKHHETVNNIRVAVMNYYNRTGYYYALAIAADLRGAEMRLGKFSSNLSENLFVKVGDALEFSFEVHHYDNPPPHTIHVPSTCEVVGLVKRDMRVLIDHGNIEMTVKDIIGDRMTCTVTKSGVIRTNQDICIPEVSHLLDIKPISEKDEEDIQFAIDNGIDFLIASHIKCGLVIDEIRTLLGNHHENIRILAKVQNKLAVDKIEEIVDKSDGIIFLPSNEMEASVVPFIQKMILNICKSKMKIFLVHLDAKVGTTEIYELANEYFNSIDGVILTRNATSNRNEQFETLRSLERVKCVVTENQSKYKASFCLEYHEPLGTLASSSVTSSFTSNASGILVISNNDLLAQYVYYNEPKCPIVAVVQNKKIAKHLNIFNGIIPLHCSISNGKFNSLRI